jgi:hypothetical protein
MIVVTHCVVTLGMDDRVTNAIALYKNGLMLDKSVEHFESYY